MPRGLGLAGVVLRQALVQVFTRTGIEPPGLPATEDINVIQLGATGFEPATLWSQTTRSSQTELRPGRPNHSITSPPDQQAAPVFGVQSVSHFGAMGFDPATCRRGDRSSQTELRPARPNHSTTSPPRQQPNPSRRDLPRRRIPVPRPNPSCLSYPSWQNHSPRLPLGESHEYRQTPSQITTRRLPHLCILRSLRCLLLFTSSPRPPTLKRTLLGAFVSWW